MKSSSAVLQQDVRSPGSAPVLSFAEIISALSFAIDLTEGAVPGHAVRSCILGMRIAAELKLPPERRASLYYALLLKDAGCSNNAARMCQIVGGDDRVMKNGAKLEDWTKPHRPSLEGLRLLWNQVLPSSTALARVGRILKIGLSQHRNNEEMIKLRCERGAEIARKLGLSQETAEAIRRLDEHWDGSGYPDRALGEAIPLAARILAVAQHLDVFACERSPDAALSALCTRSRTWFDPRLVNVAVRLARAGRLWTDCLPGDNPETARQIVVELEPNVNEGLRPGIQPEEIDRICEAFADVVDAKSPFTYRHSVGVAEVAREIAEAMHLPEERCRLVHRAALLHDLGKLAVPNTILDKTSKLTAEEWAVVVEHPRLSREILQRIKPFAELAEIAGDHHERLDGSGYPEHKRAKDLCIEARVIAVADFYRALTEDRPYRAGIPHQDAMAIMRREIHAVDLSCIEALERAWLVKSSRGRRPAWMTSREMASTMTETAQSATSALHIA
jgi:putative nucleotidyltransferase with HDIG domain